jgi:tetratricopeptide (TPR) repeat protein
LAASNFEKYLVKFPTGRFKNDATFFMANAYFSAGDKEKAIAAYQKVLEGANNSYTETSAARVAQHFYNSGKYDEAIVAYSRIDKLSSKPALIFNTKLGLMRCNFLLQNWENTVLNAKAVLESSQLNNAIRIEAEYAKGLAEFSLENYAEAKSNLEYVIKNATTVLAAEARYTLAELYAKQEDYKKADAEVNGLIKMKPSYNFWVAKGLLLQAKLSIVQKDYFQAEQRLRSIIDHYPIKDDEILTNANALLDELMQLKNQIKPVEKQEETIIDVKEEN